MSDNETLATIFEALLEQSKAVRDLKIQSETLKQMMFAHRPAFVPAFDEQMKRTCASPQVRMLDVMIVGLERAVRDLRVE
jgi:hypothetical protein